MRDPRRFDVEFVAVRLAADRVQQRLPADDFATLELGEDLRALVVEADRNDFFAKTENRAELAQLEAEALDDFAVDEIEKRGALVEQCDLNSQGGKHRRVFETD